MSKDAVAKSSCEGGQQLTGRALLEERWLSPEELAEITVHPQQEEKKRAMEKYESAMKRKQLRKVVG